MPGYCKDALTRFGHEYKKQCDQPHRHEQPTYGQTVQYAKEEDTSPKLNDEKKKFVQQVTGTFLYYARCVDPTMLMALSAIAADQSAPTEKTMQKTLYFLDYVASHPDALLTFKASVMVLNVHSDASYLTEAKARSRAGGHFFMASDTTNNQHNAPVHSIAQIIKNVMPSAAAAEIGALFINTRQAIPTRQLLEEMGHPQPPTPIQTDNTTAHGFVTKNLEPKATKSTDMNYWYMRDKQDQKQFNYYWKHGKGNNNADYHTKHHCSAHHREMRPTFLTPRDILDTLRTKRGKPLPVFTATERVC